MDPSPRATFDCKFAILTCTIGSHGPRPRQITAAQWEELEQQALIYKYMVSGVPVPTDLILSVRRSLYQSSSSSASLNQPTLGVWEGSYQLYQMGGGGRKIDLEPGRCRRTDGKKWRCSKEAYPDSKYCERHMHRGRNRSRKPVEFPSSSSSLTANVSSSSSSSSSATPPTSYPLYPSSRNTSFMDSSSFSHQTLKDYRYLQGEDERSAYLQANDQNYPHFNFQKLKEEEEAQGQGQGPHCFVMGTDFIKSSEEEATKKDKQPFHHFFSPPKSDPAWLQVDQHHHFINPPKSPLSTQDLFQSKPSPYC